MALWVSSQESVLLVIVERLSPSPRYAHKVSNLQADLDLTEYSG